MAGSMFAIKAGLLAAAVTQVYSKAFLGSNPSGQMHNISASEVELAIQRASQAGFGLAQVSSFEAELAALYATVPKNEHGRLEPATVRYVLHRFFAQKFNWFVTGLDPVGGSRTGSSPTQIMVDLVPSYIQGLFEKRMEGHGLGLREVAVFASALLDLIHRESALDLGEVSAGMPDELEVDKMGLDHHKELIKRYLITFVKGAHLVGQDAKVLWKMERELERYLFMWSDLKVWADDLSMTLDVMHKTRRNPFRDQPPFSRAVEVAREVGHQFGTFQNIECQTTKDTLVDMEDEGTGRVPLTKFYSGIDNSDWPFIESKDYLRNLGVLDETDPDRATVIIPNYIGSRSFCVFPSEYYAVCCKDECEGILAQVERAIGEPLAEPEHLARVMSHIGSDTVEAPRNLSSSQMQRLRDIATFHDGRVALHGRLFAQWLHHAYPRECQFPHVANTVSPLSQREWDKAMGVSAEISDEELHRHRRQPVKVKAEAEMPWVAAEELVAVHRGVRHQRQGSSLRLLAMLAAIASASVPLVHASKSLWASSIDKQKHAV